MRLRKLLLKESTRAWVAAAVAVLANVAVFLVGFATSESVAASEGVVVALGVFLATYAASTLAVFSLSPSEVIDRWAAEQKTTWLRRYVIMDAPGGGLALYFSIVALVVALTVLPDPRRAALFLPPWLITMVCVVMVLSAWLSISLTQALDYLVNHRQLGADALEFPGTPVPVFADYLYFAVALTATFGTTDIQIRSTILRRRATVHSIIAFIFNTLILAAVVGVLINNLT